MTIPDPTEPEGPYWLVLDKAIQSLDKVGMITLGTT
jgi:hypothetical protein